MQLSQVKLVPLVYKVIEALSHNPTITDNAKTKAFAQLFCNITF